MSSYGLIVEGVADQRVFENLIRRINSPDAPIYSYPCGGVSRLVQEFSLLLKRFEHIHYGRPVDGALVIRDADNKPVETVLAQMKERLEKEPLPSHEECICAA